MAFFILHGWMDAVKCLEREKSSKDPYLWEYVGRACVAQEDYDRAIQAFSQAIDIITRPAPITSSNPMVGGLPVVNATHLSSLWQLLGLALYAKGDLDRAAASFQKRYIHA